MTMRLAACLAAVVFCSCSPAEGTPPPADAGSTDAGSADAGSADAGGVDAGSMDAGSIDAGRMDAGRVDAGAPGAATAVEARCVELGAACRCSEPMDSNEGAVAGGHDFSKSADSTECWGGRPGFQPYQASGTNGTRAASWTPGGYALRQEANSGFIWLNPENPVSGPQAFTAADKVSCVRYYQKVDRPYGSSGNGPTCRGYCDPNPQIGCTSRNKIFQFNFQSCMGQVQEAGDGPDCTLDGTHKPFQLTVPVAPNPPANNFNLSGSLTYSQCDDAPCRFEMCVDSTNLASGDDVVIRLRVCSLETGACQTATTGNLGDCGAPTLADFWGGDLFHNSKVGGSDFAFFLSARWQTDQDQWIGPARELEP